MCAPGPGEVPPENADSGNLPGAAPTWGERRATPRQGTGSACFQCLRAGSPAVCYVCIAFRKKRQKADTGMKHLATSPHPAGEGEDRIC